MASRGSVTVERDRLDSILSQTKSIRGVRVDYGIPDPSPDHRRSQGVSVAQVLAWIEAGTVNMPARPILRWVAAAKRDEIRQHQRWINHRVLLGQDPAAELEALRADLEKWCRERMTSVGAVDTGQTRDTVTAIVVR